MDFALLGSLEVRKDGVALALGGLRERSLLAILLLNANADGPHRPLAAARR